MLTIAALILATSQTPPAAKPLNPLAPVIWINPRGEIIVDGEVATPTIDPGVSKVKTPYGIGYDFNGSRSGIVFPDRQSFKITGDMSISAWIYVRNYAPNGHESEVLFRGDDRDGWDPYNLLILNDGRLVFHVDDDKDHADNASTTVPLNQWTHVLVTLNTNLGEMSLYVDGTKMTASATKKHAFGDLDPKSVPGVGIGNVQDDHGFHNQPLNGILADLRLYPRLVSPTEAGFRYVPPTTGNSPN